MTHAATGSHDFAPVSGERLAWPEEFGTRFTLFVDTEEEFDWEAPLDRGSRQTTAVTAIPDAHHFLTSGGAKPVYLVDHPIVSDPEAVDILRRVSDEAGAAIGTQLHAWVNPPYAEEVGGYNSFAGNLDSDLEAAKLGVLTDAIARAFGTRPLIFRAGRYGLGPRTAKLLAERGYRIDSSMRARYCYADQGGPDFRSVDSHAFRMGRIVELPLTTVFTGRARRRGSGLYDALGHVPRARGVFARLGLLSRVALTPEDMPVRDALEAVRIAVGEGVRVLNFSFHSPSLVPGFTPYVRDAGDLKAFYRWWDAVLALLDKLGVRAAGQDELIAAIDQI